MLTTAPALAAPPERRWSTAAAPVEEQFGLWQHAVDDAFVPVSVSRPGAGGFTGEVSMRRLGAVDLADLAAPAQHVRRTPQQVAADGGDRFFVNVPLVDGAQVRQDGRSATLRAGDFAVVDGSRPFELDFDAGFRQVSLLLPADVLHARMTATWGATALAVRGDAGVGAVASAAIRAAAGATGAVDQTSARALGDHLVGLVALALGGVRPQPRSTSAALLLRAAADEVDRSLDDPTLSPSGVADRLGISTRYLHRLYADQGTTFGRHLLDRRLTRAHRALLDPTLQHWTIARVAADCGFADPAYFTRVFRSRHGLTPRDLRARGALQSW